MYVSDAQAVPSVVVSGAELLQAVSLCGRRATRAGNICFCGSYFRGVCVICPSPFIHGMGSGCFAIFNK